MLKKVGLSVAILLAAFSTAGLARQSDAECQASWERADKDRSGVISGTEVTPYLIALMKRKDIYYEHAKSGKITHDDFMKACKDGAFESVNLEVWDARRK